MTFLITMLTGAAGKYIAAGVAVLLIVGGYFVWLHEHDARLLAEQAARESAAAAVERVHQAELGAKAVQADAAAQIARITATSRTRQEIAHAPVTIACASSPAIAAALRSLQPQPGAGSGAPGGAAPAANMPAPAGAPKPAAR